MAERFVYFTFLSTTFAFVMGCVVAAAWPTVANVCWAVSAGAALMGMLVYLFTDPTL